MIQAFGNNAKKVVGVQQNNNQSVFKKSFFAKINVKVVWLLMVKMLKETREKRAWLTMARTEITLDLEYLKTLAKMANVLL